ncbi:MAG TPA: hypothetical protein VFG03_17710, partial [Telluria sp.]|nr:hypothetical protein [Telluria sp.]
MPTQQLNRTLIALAIAQIFAASAVAAEAPTSSSDDPVGPMQSVTIATQRTPQAVARAEQEDAPNLVNVMSADDIRKLPDVNAGEAVRRLPGVSLET